MAELPEESAEEPTVETVTDGYFEEEYYVSAEDAGEFLVELGEQLADGEEITLNGEGWELPFPFGEPVNLDIEFEGGGEPELEIEVELTGQRNDEAPDLS